MHESSDNNKLQIIPHGGNSIDAAYDTSCQLYDPRSQTNFPVQGNGNSPQNVSIQQPFDNNSSRTVPQHRLNDLNFHILQKLGLLPIQVQGQSIDYDSSDSTDGSSSESSNSAISQERGLWSNSSLSALEMNAKLMLSPLPASQPNHAEEKQYLDNFADDELAGTNFEHVGCAARNYLHPSSRENRSLLSNIIRGNVDEAVKNSASTGEQETLEDKSSIGTLKQNQLSSSSVNNNEDNNPEHQDRSFRTQNYSNQIASRTNGPEETNASVSSENCPKRASKKPFLRKGQGKLFASVKKDLEIDKRAETARSEEERIKALENMQEQHLKKLEERKQKQSMIRCRVESKKVPISSAGKCSGQIAKSKGFGSCAHSPIREGTHQRISSCLSEGPISKEKNSSGWSYESHRESEQQKSKQQNLEAENPKSKKARCGIVQRTTLELQKSREQMELERIRIEAAEAEQRRKEQSEEIIQLKRRLDTAIRDAQKEKDNAKAMVESERVAFEAWAVLERAAIEKERHKVKTANLVLEKAQRSKSLEDSCIRKDKNIVDTLQATIQKMKHDHTQAEAKRRANESRLRDLIKTQAETIEKLEDQLLKIASSTNTFDEKSDDCQKATKVKPQVVFGRRVPHNTNNDECVGPSKSELNIKEKCKNNNKIEKNKKKSWKKGKIIEKNETNLDLKQALEQLDIFSESLFEDNELDEESSTEICFELKEERDCTDLFFSNKTLSVLDHGGQESGLSLLTKSCLQEASYGSIPTLVNEPDGPYEEVRYSNGDVEKKYKNGIVSYLFASIGTTETTYSNELQVFRFANNQIEYHYCDGRRLIIFPDGSKTCVESNKKS